MAFYISDENGNLIKYAGLGNGGSIDPSLLDNLVKIDDVQNKQLYARNNQGVVTGISYDVNPTENSFPTRGVGAVLKVGTPQSDEDAATKAYVDGVINSINEFNPNLLINGDFRVNQRGQEEYGNATQYTVDRWQLSTRTNANISFNSITKTLSNTGTTQGYFIQRIEPNDLDKFWGKTWTFSAKVNGVVYSKTFTAPDTAPTSSKTISPSLVCVQNICNVRLFYYANNGSLGFTFDIRQGSVTIEYAKLELGSVATPFSPRPYAEELALCQRYYQVIKVIGGYGTVSNLGVPRNATTVRFYINLLTQLRTQPTVSNTETSIINLNTGAITQIDDNSLAFQSLLTNQIVLNYATTGLTLGQIYNLTDLNGQLKIEFDAEIY